MKYIYLLILLSTAYATRCGSNAPKNCRQCKIDGGSICNECSSNYFNSGTICLSCDLSKCEECNGQSTCAKCPPSVKQTTHCTTCEENKLWLNRQCVDPSIIGCEKGDGSHICECGNNGSYCCKNNVGVRHHNDTHCVACEQNCAVCSVRECTKCMDGYELTNVDLGGDTKKFCLSSFGVYYFVSAFAFLSVILWII